MKRKRIQPTHRWINFILMQLFGEGKITFEEYESVMWDWYIREGIK